MEDLGDDPDAFADEEFEEFPSFPANDDSGTPVPVRVETDRAKDAGDDALRRANEAAQHSDDVVREYQERYYGDGETRRKRNRAETLANDVKTQIGSYDWQPHAATISGLGEEEKLWAALAHASFLLTLGVGVISGGIGSLLLLFVPLAIYFAYRDRSEFIAYHALQAFALQVVGTVGWAALLITGTIVLGIATFISALASIVLIGIPFLIVFALLFVVFALVMVVLPFGLAVFSAIAAFNTYTGKDYRYPVIATWIDRQSTQETHYI
jgi:uncharacterized Tic20 family protein